MFVSAHYPGVQQWEVVTTTNNGLYANTLDPIYMRMNGTFGTSERLTLDPLGGKRLREGTIDNFIFHTDNIGELRSLTLELEGSDGWLVNKIIITNLKTMKEYTFRNSDWLDDKLGHGQTAVLYAYASSFGTKGKQSQPMCF